MSEIVVDRNPSQQKLDALGVAGWPIWEKEVSEFPWHYDAAERCLILEGEVTVTPDHGAPVTVSAGDFVIFPAGMDDDFEKSHHRTHGRVRKSMNCIASY